MRGHQNILTWLLVHAGAFDLGLLMRKAFGRGTPHGLQGRRLAIEARSTTIATLVDRVSTAALGLLPISRPMMCVLPAS